MPLEDTLKWIERVLIPMLIKSDRFRECIIEKCTVRAVEGMKDNWASMMFEVDLTVTRPSGQESLALLLKIMDENEKVREQMQSVKQFSNEIHLYSVIVPLFMSLIKSSKEEVEKLFPKCFYTYAKENVSIPSLEDSVIIMENLKPKQFKLGNRTYLDMKHCTLAMRLLGSFHALSYFMKKRDPDTFKNMIVKPIQECNYSAEGANACNAVFEVSQRRVLDALAKELPHDHPGLARLQDIASRNAFDVFTELVVPSEPMAVVCHGDFLRNNVLFRYEDDTPVEMKLIDFQTIRYASPTIDVSLFLCMNTSHELRVLHLEKLLLEYHESVLKTLAALKGKTDKPHVKSFLSFSAFKEDFRKRALYGYLISIEFIPWMMANDEDLAEFVELFRNEHASPKYLEKARVLGGDAATEVLVNLAKDLIANDFL